MTTIPTIYLRTQAKRCNCLIGYNNENHHSQTIRALLEVPGQNQAEFLSTIGAPKDTVASWETGRYKRSAALARRPFKQKKFGMIAAKGCKAR